MHKDMETESNQTIDAILGRTYGKSHLLSLERSNIISEANALVNAFFLEK